MAAPAETLNLPDPKPEHSSGSNSAMATPSSTPNPSDPKPELEPEPSDIQSTEATNPGEKRKRVDSVEEEEEEAKAPQHPLWKTSLCSYFRSRDGVCSHGSSCRYAHGEEELRQRPDSTWDPTSDRAKKLMKIEIEAKPENGEPKEEEVLMTDAVVGSSEPALDKCLVHLPMKWTSDLLNSYLKDQGMLFKSAKKKKGMTVGFVSFETSEQVQTAIEELDGKCISGNKSLKVVDVIPRSFEKNTKSLMQHASGGDEDAEGLEEGDTIDEGVAPVSKGRCVRDVVTPLAQMPYADQLENKKSSLMQTLKRLTRNARKVCRNGVPLPEWILKSREIGGLPCIFEGIIESPLVNGYRNKCEFSVGYSLQGKPTVGFTLGNFREGVTAVEEPVDCLNVSSIASKYASIFQEFLQQSGLPVWNRLNNTGFWRQLTVREGRKPANAEVVENLEANIAEVLLMVQVSSRGYEDEMISSEFEKMYLAFSMGAAASSPSLPLTSLVVQDHQGISNVAAPDAPLRTLAVSKPESDANNVLEARIHDYISNLQFCISPTAFFQVNTLAAEKLYSLAGDWACLGPDTLLFDVCCGTGTIGLTLAHRVGMVVGIEMNASAVSDAQRNAEINGIENCRFVCGKAEDVMGSLLKEYLNRPQKPDEISNAPESTDKETMVDINNLPKESPSRELENGKGASECLVEATKEVESQNKSEDGSGPMQQFKNVVAIVDPPRVGLHPTVIKALRTHPRLRRLVYISCNPDSLVANAIELCTPSAEKIEKGNNNNRGWRNMSSAGLARHRAKSMPNSEPFRPVKAMAVDLFPHTPHCETVMLLER